MNSSSTDTRTVRRFGGAVLLVFGSLCALAVWRNRPVGIGLFGFLSALGCCFVLIPGPSRPLYEAWLRVSARIGQVLNLVLLVLSYYLVIFPAALVKRVLGGRPLPMRPDPRKASFWVDRPEPAQPADRFRKRF